LVVLIVVCDIGGCVVDGVVSAGDGEVVVTEAMELVVETERVTLHCYRL